MDLFHRRGRAAVTAAEGQDVVAARANPVLSVTGKGSGWVSMAAVLAFRPGLRTRMLYRIHVYHGRKTAAKGFGEADYKRLLCAVHAQLRAPVIVVWDNLNQAFVLGEARRGPPDGRTRPGPHPGATPRRWATGCPRQ